MEDQFSALENCDYERRVLNKLVPLSRHKCGLVNPYLAFSKYFEMDPGFDSIMERAEKDGLVTAEQVFDLYSTDAIISAPGNRHMLAETCITLGNDDVDRAKWRAAVLAIATRGDAIPVVVTAYAETAQTEYAASQEVAIFRIPYP